MSLYNKTSIDVRTDGVYVRINHDSIAAKADILKLIQKYCIQDVNYIAIENALRDRDDEVCVSRNTNVIARNESIDIDFSADKMTGYITFREPFFGGKKLSFEDIMVMLPANGIKFGIDKERVKELVENKEYDEKYAVAFGERPTESRDGYIEYFFKTEKQKPKPKELEDGSVDYRNIDMFEVAKEKQVLAVQHPAISGADGMTVAGRVAPAGRAKRAPVLPRGKNTSILEDGVTLVADIGGRVFYMDGRVSILPVLEISGDVDSSTGNIDFIGSVSISGGIKSGFSVVAGANVEVFGSVEAATIRTKGDIILSKGVQGGGKAIIEAGGSIHANFMENCTISAKGDINASSIMHSKVKCGGTITLIGRKGLLVGGKIIVGKKVSARTIGSYMSTVTEIEVGVDPDVLEAYNVVSSEISNYVAEYEKLEKIIETLSKVDAVTLSPEKKKILMDSLRTKIVYKAKINDMQAKIDNFKSQISSKNGIIEAAKIYNGVKVTINNAVMYIRDDLDSARLYNKDGKVYCGIK